MKPAPAAAIPVSYAGEDFPSLSALARHLARRFGRQESTVLTYLSRHRGDVERVVQIISIDRKPPIPWSPQQIEQLRGLWAGGGSASEIGRRLGMSRHAVLGKVRRLSLPGHQ
jgi:DNA-binding CsgD family transcriptional regulator